ncbi:hypothetical protein ACFOGI_13695 [Virgibacillus xinjiangensis]|uniref:Uncharacterized protein n=1 Tax=Virgibacillus xinjiangensis TaxID=393090 RepID=A0ABV7CY76_9BACI
MNEHALSGLSNLERKIQQHEETIAQLLKIIAETNQVLFEMAKVQQQDRFQSPPS